MLGPHAGDIRVSISWKVEPLRWWFVAFSKHLIVTTEELGRGGAAIVYAGTYKGEEVAVKRISLEGRVEVRLPKLVGADDEVVFGREVAKAIKRSGPQLAQHLCYCRHHRKSVSSTALESDRI